MDCSTFENHGKGLFLLKNRHTTIYGSHFWRFLPSASLAPIIYGGLYGRPTFLKIFKKIEIWYCGSPFFSKK